MRLYSLCCEPVFVRKSSMKNTKWIALATMAVIAASAYQPAFAQGNGAYRQNSGGYNDQRNENNYQTGYRAGYNDGRANRRYDDNAGNNNNRNDRYNGNNGNNGNDRSDDRTQRWQQRYSRASTYNDDHYYQECRQSSDPAGILAGAVIGGLLGNTVASGNSRGGATVAGVILGGVLGASLTQNLDCEDRSYSYRTYSEGFNNGRPNQTYEWRNPRNGRHGALRVGSYYNDPDGFRCATFSQAIYINGRTQEGRGLACQQPDGSWTIVG